GTITPGKNTFRLQRTTALDSYYSYLVVDDAWVVVRGTDGSEYRTEGDYGTFTCTIDELNPNVQYYLHIETDGEVYESDPQTPLRTEKIAEVRGDQSTPRSDIDILVTPAEPYDNSKINYYTWTYEETWEVHPEYNTFVYYDVENMQCVKNNHLLYPERGWKDEASSTIMVGSSTNYDAQHIQQLKIYDISRESEKMYVRYSGLVHQRAISKAEYEYELARRQAGSEMGGLFTPQPSALPTNIHCLTSKKHVIGFVGCALNTSEYRFFLEPKDYSIYHPIDKDKRRWVEAPSADECVELVKSGLHLCEWDDTYMSPEGVPILQTAWAYEYLLDVRLRGAYIEEPDFWHLTENVSY
ncbi:MAG: hypothetical protein IKM78_01755, partial [Prevotella sp.]|nr:hypothetical protein [Prevotella sp.]